MPFVRRLVGNFPQVPRNVRSPFSIKSQLPIPHHRSSMSSLVAALQSKLLHSHLFFFPTNCHSHEYEGFVAACEFSTSGKYVSIRVLQELCS